MISIEVRYKLVGASQWHRRQLTPSEYFWADPDSSKHTWDVDSVPKHNQVGELLSIGAADELELAITRVSNSIGEYFECAYHFWGSSEDYVSLVTHHREEGTRKELIFCGRMPFKDNGTQVVRVALDDQIPRLTMNCFIWGPGGDDGSLDMLRPKEANNALKGNG